MRTIFIIVALSFFVSCSQKSNKSVDIETLIEMNDSIEMKVEEPLKMIIIWKGLINPDRIQYELTKGVLKIFHIFDWEKKDKRDSIPFETQLPQDILDLLSVIRIDSLKDYYANGCVMDGFFIRVFLENKIVNVVNYYQPEIGFLIETINHSIPEKHKIGYDKKRLIKNQERCGGIMESLFRVCCFIFNSLIFRKISSIFAPLNARKNERYAQKPCTSIELHQSTSANTAGI